MTLKQIADIANPLTIPDLKLLKTYIEGLLESEPWDERGYFNKPSNFRAFQKPLIDDDLIEEKNKSLKNDYRNDPDYESRNNPDWNLYPGNEAGAFDHLDSEIDERTFNQLDLDNTDDIVSEVMSYPSSKWPREIFIND